MRQTTIESDERDIHIDCPHCDMWEQLGVDDPRKRLNVLPIIEWVGQPDGYNELSVNKCMECKSHFYVVWDYNNKIEKL